MTSFGSSLHVLTPHKVAGSSAPSNYNNSLQHYTTLQLHVTTAHINTEQLINVMNIVNFNHTSLDYTYSLI